MRRAELWWTLTAMVAMAGCAGGPGASAPREHDVDEPVYRPMLVVGLPQLRPAQPTGRVLDALSARNTPVADVLLGMFKDSDINLLVDQQAQAANCTFDIKHATVEEAFESLLRSLDLGYEWDGSFLRVRAQVQETFFIDLLAPSQAGPGGNGTAAAGSSAGGAAKADFWTEMEKVLPQLLGKDGKYIVNQAASTIHVEASPAAVERLREVVQTTLRRRNAQVSLEARVLEVRLNDKHDLGVNWALLPGLFNSARTGLATGGAIARQTAASGGSALNVGMLDNNDFSVFVDALEQQGQVRVLSSPRVSTMNNVPANIRVVDQVPIISREIVDTQGVSRTQFSVKFAEAGVSVQVTPMIGEDGMITVDVQPQITEQTGTVVTPDGLIEEPLLSTRATSTIVRVADGQAVVLGGLRSTRKDETRSGVPFLMDIPVLGQLFSSTVQSRTEVELMIVLVPRVLDSAWIDEEVRRGAHRLVTLRRPFQWNSIRLESRQPEDWEQGGLQGSPAAAATPAVRVPVAAPAADDSRKGLTVTRGGLADRLLARAQDALDDNQQRQAVTLLESALQLEPRRIEALVAAGVLHARLGDRLRARSCLERALALQPDDPMVHTALGALDLQDGASHAGRRHLEAAHARLQSGWSAANLGAALLQVGDTAAARSVLRERADADSAPELHANLAFAELATGEIEAAKACLLRALAAGADPRNPRIVALQRMLDRAAGPASTR